MNVERETWIQVHQEDPLAPVLPICDPHHHLRKAPANGGDHMSEQYLMEEFHAEGLDAISVVRSVFIELGTSYFDSGPEVLRPVGETEFVRRVTREFADSHQSSPVVSGIVGYVDLQSEEVEAVLEAHVAAGGGMFRGVRYMTQFDPSPTVRSVPAKVAEVMKDARFRAGIGTLGTTGLSFDAWVYHPQLADLADLAHTQPGTSIIVNHLGGPLGVGPYGEHPQDAEAQWKAGLTKLAVNPNVFLKLSGVGLNEFGPKWPRGVLPPSSQDIAEVWGDRIRWCIDLFGADRCMFASNFPGDRARMRYSYAVMWNAFKRMVTGASPSEMALLFHDSACRAYRLV